MMEAWQLQHRKKLSLKGDEDGSSDCRPRKTKRLAAASYYRFGPQCLPGLLPINGGFVKILSGLPAFDATMTKAGCDVIPPNVAVTR
jgi:hypothetical protein